MSDPQPSRGLTPRAIIIGLVLVIAWAIYDCTLAVDEALHAIEVLYLIGFGALFTLFVVKMLSGLWPEPRRLSASELVVIFAMVAVAIPWGILIRGAIEAPAKLAIISTGQSDPTPGMLTGLWVPKSRDAIETFRRGGCGPWDIPWSAWAKPVLYWTSLLVSFQAFAIFTVLFFRRIFVDEEKLAFPLAQVGQAIVEHKPASEDAPEERSLGVWRLVAFAIGVAVCAPSIFRIAPDASPDITMNSAYYGTNIGFAGLSVRFSWDPFVLCFLMFFSTDVLLTAVLAWGGLNVVVPVLWRWFGVPPPPVSEITMQVCAMGGLLGLAVWSIVFNRSLLGDFLRRAFRKFPEGRGSEPVSHRVVVWGMALSFVAFSTLFVVGLIDWTSPHEPGGLLANLHRHLISLPIIFLIIIVMLIAHMRQAGEVGWHYHSPWSVGKAMAYAHKHWFIHDGGGLPRELFRTQGSFLSLSGLIHFAAYHNAFSPHLHALDSLRMASGTNTDTRDVMKGILLSLLVGAVVVVPLYLVVIHYYGFEHGATSSDWFNFWNYSEPQHGIAYSEFPTIFNRWGVWSWIPILVGAGIVGLIMYFRRERVGFPLSPAGFVIAGAMSYFTHYSTSAIWFPMLIVLLVKLVIYKWFGVAFFRRRVIPVVLFAMMGLMSGMLLYKIILASMGRGFLRPY